MVPRNSYGEFDDETGACKLCNFLPINQESLINHKLRGHVALPTQVYANTGNLKIGLRPFKPEDYYGNIENDKMLSRLVHTFKTIIHLICLLFVESNGGLFAIIMKIWAKDNVIGISVSKTTYGNTVLAAKENKKTMKYATRNNVTMFKKACSSRILLPEGFEVICEETLTVPIPPFQGTLCSSNGKWVVRNILQKVCVDTFMPPEAISYLKRMTSTRSSLR